MLKEKSVHHNYGTSSCQKLYIYVFSHTVNFPQVCLKRLDLKKKSAIWKGPINTGPFLSGLWFWVISECLWDMGPVLYNCPPLGTGQVATCPMGGPQLVLPCHGTAASVLTLPWWIWPQEDTAPTCSGMRGGSTCCRSFKATWVFFYRFAQLSYEKYNFNILDCYFMRPSIFKRVLWSLDPGKHSY